MKVPFRITLSILISSVLLFSQVYSIQSEDSNNKFDNLINHAWRSTTDQITVVYINGSFYEMGYQLGYLLASEINETIRGFHHHYEQLGIPYQAFIDLWKQQEPYIPQQIIQYTLGIANGSGLPFLEIATLWVYDGVLYNKCSSFVVWGNTSKDGRLYHVRSLDGPGSIQDPITGKYVQENAVLIVGNPDEGQPFCYPTFAGYVVEGGMNAKGITVCNLWSPNTDSTIFGSPMGVRLFQALYSSESANEAIHILTTNKTFGYNFLVGDANIPAAYAVETTANQTYIGTWDNYSENIQPFWTIKESIRRSNCYLDPDLADTQRSLYSPRSLRYIFNTLPMGVAWYHSWLRYISMGKAIERYNTQIDLNLSVTMLRKVYHGGYDLIWFVLNKIYNPMQAWWQWAACPETGDILLSFASKEKLAYDTPVYAFNIFQILTSPP